MLTPGNFYDEGGFKSKSGIEKFYSAEPPDDYVLHRDDLVVAMTEQVQGLLGSSALIPEDGVYLHNQRIGLVELARDVDRRFIYYLFNTPHVRNQIQATATGSKIRHTAPSRIEAVEVAFPPLPVQRKIAAILCAYDDLIENNNRRIKILEESVQRIYREWLVDFRYPGHEAVPLVDSDLGMPIPYGWELRRVGDIAEDVRTSVDPRKVDPETPYIGLQHLPERSIAICQWDNAASAGSGKLSFKVGDILFGKIRPYFHKVGPPPVAGICSTDAIVIRPRRPELMGAVLAVVSGDAFVQAAVQTSQGTKMPRANWRVLEAFPVAMPPADLLAGFNTFVQTVVSEIHCLVLAIRNLGATRDLILPRLISGEIDVDGLDIEVPGAAA